LETAKTISAETPARGDQEVMPTRRASRPRARTRAKHRPKDRKTGKSIPTFHTGRRNGGRPCKAERVFAWTKGAPGCAPNRGFASEAMSIENQLQNTSIILMALFRYLKLRLV
jgi:hypothetical protein